jgi:hypothetical protein
VRVPAFQAVRMLRGQLLARARRHADDQRHAELAVRHMPKVAAVLRIWSSAKQREIDRHHLDDRPHAASAAPMPAPVKPDSDSGVSRMRSSARTCPAGPWRRRSSRRRADILAHQEHAIIASPSRPIAALDGLAIGHGHRLAGWRQASVPAARTLFAKHMRQGSRPAPRCRPRQKATASAISRRMRSSICSTRSHRSGLFSSSQPWNRTIGPF